MNTISRKTKVCRCGRTYEPSDRHQRSCHDCAQIRKAIKELMPRPIRQCNRCGADSRECIHGLCPACEKARMAALKAERQAEKVAAVEARKAKRKGGHTTVQPAGWDLSHLAEGAIVVPYVVGEGYRV